MTTPSQAATAAGRPDPPQPAVSVNGATPGPAAEECGDCVPAGQKAVAVAGFLIAAGIAFMAADVLSGFRLSAALGFGQKEQTESVTDPGA